jgi:hypothetical protein
MAAQHAQLMEHSVGCVRVRACVCVRERERERGGHNSIITSPITVQPGDNTVCFMYSGCVGG